MAIFPKIQSPCPYKATLAAMMDGDMCRLCQRQVHDITDWTDDQRVSFLAGCSEEVCVSYSLPVKVAVAAALAVATLAAPMAAAAQDCPDVQVEVIVGGIHDPANTQMIETAADKAMPELPVVYEDAAPVAPATAPADKTAQPAKARS
ncbi:putative Fe-S protein YdhL (DUF1289 family) [Caulobacter ginsengisoli]|uniref:Fe-S protein YdhL (DUF1289 family) n=1 Tax=Caulobacter ginsengisoli TaxID=400775 RepID=A0ABU0IQT7_9CAUL|nr:hypothetical protein [Caulobacter ginsengisoli]MDQ0464381.1 putative Fe-S protein YdhL (DUF1289 family) [Caulobacter ginsengisoli]